MTSRVRGLLMAVLCGLVLFARVYADFPSTRWKEITDSAGRQAERGSLAIDIPYVEILANQTTPIVVIARLDNPSPNDVTINISWNDKNVGRVAVGGSSSKRIDLTLPVGSTLRGEDRLRFRGPDAPWKVTYLELANLHGSTRGVVNAVFVPAAVRIEPMLPWPIVLAIVGVLIFLAWLEGSPWAWKPLRIAHAIVIGLVATLFAASLLTPFVSPYKILIARDTFWICTALVFARGAWRGVVAMRDVAAPRVLGSTAAFDSIVVALLVANFFTAVMVIRLNYHRGNYSGFLQLQKQLIETTPMLEGRDDLKKDLRLVDGGYDGMFMYLMAFDPFMSRFKDNPIRYEQVVDTPPYRYTRIGYSLLTKLFAWNRPERFPMTMVWMILVSHFFAALALGAIIRHHGGHPAWALLYAFIPGFLQSLNSGLPESIAAAGLLTGIWLIFTSRFALASVCLAATLLVRETSAIAVVMMVLWLWLSRRDWRGGFVVGLAIAPLVAWRAFITWRLFPAYGWNSFFFSPGNLARPFKGIAELWDVIGRGEYFLDFPPLAVAGRLFPLLLIAALIVSAILLWKRRDGLSAAAFAASVIAVSLDFPHVWAHVGNSERVTFDVFVFLLAIFGTMVGGRAVGQNGVGQNPFGQNGIAQDGVARRRATNTLALRLMLMVFFAATAVYTIYFSLDSPLVRQVLLDPTAAIF